MISKSYLLAVVVVIVIIVGWMMKKHNKWVNGLSSSCALEKNDPFTLDGRSGELIEYITITTERDDTSPAITITDSDDITISNVEIIHTSKNVGISISGSSNVKVR